MQDKTSSISKKVKALRMDIVEAGQRYAQATSGPNRISYYVIGLYVHNRRDLMFWTGKKYRYFPTAMKFPTEEAAFEHIKENDIEYLDVYPIDEVKADFTLETCYEISKILDGYADRKLCPICKKNAAVKDDLRGRRREIAYRPCRSCSVGEDDLSIDDFVEMRSSMGQFAEVEQTPRFTKEDIAILSREAAKRRIFPREALTMNNACINVQ